MGSPWRRGDPGGWYQLQSGGTCERRLLRTKTSKPSSPATVQTWEGSDGSQRSWRDLQMPAEMVLTPQEVKIWAFRGCD